MADYITLMGAEDVRRAAGVMSDAADGMQRAASSISDSIDRLQRLLEDHAARIEASMARPGEGE